MNYIILAVPFFVLLIVIEIIVDHYRKTGYYRINDAISSLNTGILSRVDVVFRALIPFIIYSFVYQNFALFKLQESLGVWIFAFILYDFFYYWKHRMGHEINLLWASHVAHHSSEDYNLTTALRQTSGDLFGWIFVIPMAIIGINPLMLAAVFSLNLLYQFWVHTRHIQKLGWYEWVFITPSNHRVHHAVNQIYIDKNYGGVFILWDKIFGTYQTELDDQPCQYGIRKPIKSWDPIWVNLHFYAQLLKDAWHTKSWKDKLLLWIKPTGWRPDDVEKQFPLTKFDPKKFNQFNIPIPKFNKYYALLQHLLLAVIAFLYMKNITLLSTNQQLSWGAFIIFSGYCIAMVLEGKRFGIWLEYCRYGVLAMLVLQHEILELTSAVALTLISIVLIIFLKPMNKDVKI